MNNTVNAHDIFSALDQELHSREWTSLDSLLSRQMKLNHEILAVFAVRKADGRHFLYLQCNQEDASKGFKYPAWKGISIDFSGFDNPGIEGCYVRIEQGEASDNEVFFAVSDDLCSCLKEVKRSNLRKSLSAALERWKRFFSLRESIGLSAEEQIGLFGELWLLRSLLQNGIHHRVVECWKGPHRGVFDFSLGKMSIEVKTTAAKKPYKVYINNEIQLDDHLAGGTLILCFIAVQAGDSTGDTLEDMVKCVENFIKDEEAVCSLFQDKLFGCGLGNFYVDKYETKFIIKEHAFFTVKEGFPRILSKNLPNGLGDISYSLEISACAQFKVDDQEFWQTTELHVGEKKI